MAQAAVLRDEHILASLARWCERAIRRSVRARRYRRERTEIRSERIEIRRESGLRIAERLATRSGMEARIAHQSGAEREVADLSFEVLNLVEVAGPVHRAIRDAALPI